MTSLPSKISVIMSVYNTARFLPEAIESILNQTYTHFEFIIVNDGSTDGTSQILTQYAARDPRIKVLSHERSLGVAKAFNLGISRAEGEFIARMDPDDRALPRRFARQVDFLQKNPEVGILGTWIRSMREDGTPTGVWKNPLHHDAIGWELIFSNCVAHPSAMMRHSVVKELNGYDERFGTGLDYDLWVRAHSLTRIEQLPDPLLLWRNHNQAMTSRLTETRAQVHREMIERQVRRYLGEDAAKTLPQGFYRLASRSAPLSAADARLTGEGILRLAAAYQAVHQQLPKHTARALAADKLLLLAATCIGKFPGEAAHLTGLFFSRTPSLPALFRHSLAKTALKQLLGRS